MFSHEQGRHPACDRDFGGPSMGDPTTVARAFNADDLPLARLYRWERERAGQVFLTQPFGGGELREWTWAQAAEEARRVAAYLKAQNWEPGSRIAILSRNCAWWILADLAVWMAGHVSVPIYPSLNWRTIRQILEHSESKGCFLGATDEKEAGNLAIPPNVNCISLPTGPAGDYPSWDAIIARNPPLAGNPLRAAEDLATIIYTSGTTGTPKGVMHCFGAFGYFARHATELLGLTADDRMLSYLPLAHIIERATCESFSLFLGFHLFFTEGIETFVTDLKRARPTLFPSVPRLLLKFQQGVLAKIPKDRLDTMLRLPLLNRVIKKRILNQLGLSDARYAASGGAALPLEILLWYRNLGLDLFEGFGMTETWVTHIPAPGKVRPGFVGAALEGVQVKVTAAGELMLKSPMNMLGYYKDPQGTRDAFAEDGFFRTGDIVHLDPDGQLKIVGRVKEQFKTSKGKYVAPAPIESELMAHPAIEACCLMGAGLPSPFVVAVLTAEARKKCDEQAGRKALEQSLEARMEEVNARLDPHERVKRMVIVEGPWTIADGLVTPTLKIRRSALEARYQTLIRDWENASTRIVWESAPARPESEADLRATVSPG